MHRQLIGLAPVASPLASAFQQLEGRPVSNCSDSELFELELELGGPSFPEYAAMRRAAREEATEELRRRGAIAR